MEDLERDAPRGQVDSETSGQSNNDAKRFVSRLTVDFYTRGSHGKLQRANQSANLWDWLWVYYLLLDWLLCGEQKC
jgi:hypothetical protein